MTDETKRSDKETTQILLDALIAREGFKTIWATELALGSGVRRCDFWTLHPHASKGYCATAYEIKVSRSDFRRDNAVKQREARLYSDYFYYVAPAGMIKPEEVPDWAGLIEAHETSTGDIRFKTKLPAARRDKDSPSWELVVAIMRNSGEIRRDTDLLNDRIRVLEASNKRLIKTVSEAQNRAHAYYGELTKLKKDQQK